MKLLKKYFYLVNQHYERISVNWSNNTSGEEVIPRLTVRPTARRRLFSDLDGDDDDDENETTRAPPRSRRRRCAPKSPSPRLSNDDDDDEDKSGCRVVACVPKAPLCLTDNDTSNNISSLSNLFENVGSEIAAAEKESASESQSSTPIARTPAVSTSRADQQHTPIAQPLATSTPRSDAAAAVTSPATTTTTLSSRTDQDGSDSNSSSSTDLSSSENNLFSSDGDDDDDGDETTNRAFIGELHPRGTLAREIRRRYVEPYAAVNRATAVAGSCDRQAAIQNLYYRAGRDAVQTYHRVVDRTRMTYHQFDERNLFDRRVNEREFFGFLHIFFDAIALHVF